MKRLIAKILAFVLVCSVAVPVLTMAQQPIVASAAEPALTERKATLVLGSTYTLKLQDETGVRMKVYKSSNTKIAKVNGKGEVTPVKTGNVKIACTVTLTSGVQRKLICNITVKNRVAAKSVSLNAVHDKLNAHTIAVEGKYDFDAKLSPTSTTDTVFYSIADKDIARVDDNGVVTALKEGVTVLEARAGHNKTEANRLDNPAVAKTYILVTPKEEVKKPTPTPSVAPQATGVHLVSSKEIQIKFNTQIDKSSVVDSNGDLIFGAIAIVPGAKATAVGNLSVALSEDQKSIHLTASGEFNGTYIVSVFNKIMSKDGQIMAAATFQADFKDNIGPAYVSTQVDDRGYTSKINFNEAIDISGLAILSVNGTSNASLKSYLSSTSNYKLSADKKSLTINLESFGEKALNVMVTMAGLKDLKGNSSVQYQVNTLVQTDATPKPIANVVEVKRVSKTLLIATFDRPIQYGGYVTIDGSQIVGVIDSEDSKQVKYTLANTSLTGIKNITFYSYLNYNVINASGNSQTRAVDFTLDITPPKAVAYELAMTTEQGISVHTLTLTYDKKISVVNGSGSLSSLVHSTNGNIYSKTITYTATASANKLVLTFPGQNFEAGYYSITLPAGLVVDDLENLSTIQEIGVGKQVGSSASLAQPTNIAQELTNPSIIRISFANKLDLVSAQNVGSYLVNNAITPISAKIVEQSETNSIVELTFAPGAFSSTGTYTIRISGIKGYNDSYSQMKEYNTILSLVDNSGAQVKSYKLTSPTMVQIELTKNVTGSGDFMISTNLGLMNATATYVAGDVIYISLPSAVTDTTLLILTRNDFRDANNNLANIPSQMLVQKSY